MSDTPSFDSPDLLDWLEAQDVDRFDELCFGLITMDRQGNVLGYNTVESERAGLGRDRVIGRNFFLAVGPCTNNYLVAHRYTQDAALDEELEYVFTFRMRPTPVVLRLLLRRGSARQYLAVRSR